MRIIKRDLREKEFDRNRIENAIEMAQKDVNKNDETLAIRIADMIEDYISENQLESITVEEIQDLVIEYLKQEDYEVARVYEEYRNERTFEREKKSSLDKEIDNIVNCSSEESTANGNVDGSKIQSIRALVANVACRDHARRQTIPKKFRKKHKKELYIHDEQYFDLPFFNCCLVNWEDMFEHGFDLGTTHIEPPKSLATAINVMTQVTSHVSSNTYGGTTLPSLVTGLTKYGKLSLNKYRKLAQKWIDDKNKQEDFAWDRLNKEIIDSIQSLEYEIQTLMTSRGETPFLTLGVNNVDLNTDNESQEIQRLITKAILNQRIKGLTGGVTPVFPKLIYQNTKGNNLNPEDPNYDLFKLAVKCSAYRQYPDYTNTDKVIEVTGDYKEPMGKHYCPCKTYLNGEISSRQSRANV